MRVAQGVSGPPVCAIISSKRIASGLRDIRPAMCAIRSWGFGRFPLRVKTLDSKPRARQHGEQKLRRRRPVHDCYHERILNARIAHEIRGSSQFSARRNRHAGSVPNRLNSGLPRRCPTNQLTLRAILQARGAVLQCRDLRGVQNLSPTIVDGPSKFRNHRRCARTSEPQLDSRGGRLP